MKKITIIIVGIIIVIVVAFGISWLLQRNASNNNSTGIETGTLPPISTSTVATPVPTSTTITLGTSQGEVTMNNFYQTAQTIAGPAVIIQQNAEYSIVYNVGDSSFSIALLSTPLNAARQAAEAELLSALGISQQDACKLTVYEGIPASVSDQYVAQDFSLSFCGGPSTL